MKRLVSLAVSLSLVLSLVPTPALAEVIDELEVKAPDGVEQAAPEEEPEPEPEAAEPEPEAASTPEPETEPSPEADPDPDPTPDEPALAPQAIEDPFFLVDVETGERTTTLHTSGSYRLVNPDGTPYLDDPYSVTFIPWGDDPRGNSSYTLTVKPEYPGWDYDATPEGYLLENFECTFYGESLGWELPSGDYLISFDGEVSTAFATRYKVVCDGLFHPYYDFAAGNDHAFSAKPYTEGKTDEQYDGQYYDAEAGYYYEGDSVAEQEPFAPASDVRLKFKVGTAVELAEGTQPQLESIGLWKVDESPADLAAAYAEVSEFDISRAAGWLNPSWPTYITFAKDYASKAVTLWDRASGTGALSARYMAANDLAGSFIVDQASFPDALVEEGTYFPVVRMTYGDESYTFAYYPISVTAAGAAERIDPRITTSSLSAARVGEAYEATLAARSGARDADGSGTFAWAVTEGSLPAGLALDAQTGVISGTPTEAGRATFTITLTETIDGEPRTATRAFTLDVKEDLAVAEAVARLSLGTIACKQSVVWPKDDYMTPTFLDLTIPVSLDVRDYGLGKTELWYLLELETGSERQVRSYVFHEDAAEAMSADGTTLQVHAIVQQGNKGISDVRAVKSVTAFLVPKTDAGAYAFELGALTGGDTGSDGATPSTEPVERTLAFRYGTSANRDDYVFIEENSYSTYPSGDYATYANLPDVPHATLSDPAVTIGSHVGIPALQFDGDRADWPTTEGRIRLWAYDGTTEVGDQQVKTLTTADVTLDLAPGTYVLVVEGSVPTYDENGVDTGANTWVDIVGAVKGATKLKGTYPTQYVITVGPHEGTPTSPKMLDVTYTGDAIEDTSRHSISATFELSDGRFVSSRDAGTRGYVQYQVAWYRRVNGSDVLVATGDTVMFGPSDYPLYVELTPMGRDVSFWKPTGRLLVSDKNKVVSIKVPRRQHFNGTFTLSCASGDVPEAGRAWGVVEVRTPLDNGYISNNYWAFDSTITVPGLTAGSQITFTPNAALDSGPASYTVPDEATSDVTADLVAPLVVGTINFEGLSFTDVDGQTAEFALDDGATGLTVERNYGSEASWVTVPFYMASGSRIVLQPEYDYYDAPSFMSESGDTTYRITVKHKDVSAPERFGAEAADYAARASFTVTLSPSSPTAQVPAATLTSRGYALVSMDGAQRERTTLLLYRTTVGADGAVEQGELVDKGPAGSVELASVPGEMRTPFLDAGTYRLYSVDSNLLYVRGNYTSLTNLQRSVLAGDNAKHAVGVDFTVADGAVTNLGDGSGQAGPSKSALWSWYGSVSSATSLVDRANSSVSAEVAYNDRISIGMHAELADGAQIGDGAYLEVVTNQGTSMGWEGLMNPLALNINGKALALNRWENLFGQTQKMQDGTLRILLSEAKKQASECASFPMDLTLVIPFADRTAIDVSIWLVSGNNGTRALVGSCHKQSFDVSLTAPPVVAWQTFSVYGETGPDAYVIVYVDGMRAATTRANSYGYYTAEVALPEDVQDFDSFELSAVAQWEQDDAIRTATTETQEVTYSTSVPVVERITTCYQSDVGEPYRNSVAYYRGVNPNKYLTLYRSENEKGKGADDDHAKYFWLVEFANGEDVGTATVKVPLSSETRSIETTDVLSKAQSWIPDVMDGTYGSGPLVTNALKGTTLRGFVSKPAYFASAPTEVLVDFDVDVKPASTRSLACVEDLAAIDGSFQGFKASGVTKDVTTGYLGKAAESGYLYYLSDADAASLRAALRNNAATGVGVKESVLTSRDAMATSLMDQAAGCADDWMLLGVGAEHATEGGSAEDEGPMLLVHHVTATSHASPSAIESEVQGLIDATQPSRTAFARWCKRGSVDNASQAAYRGEELYFAIDGSMEGVDDPTCLYNIATKDAAGNVSWETLQKYLIYGTDTHYYTYWRIDKESFTCITWDEAHSKRVELSYTIAPEQVSEQVMGIGDLNEQWAMALGAIHRGLNFALGFEYEDAVAEDLSAQSVGEASDDDVTLTAQSPWTEFVGWLEGDSQKFVGSRVANEAGIKSTDECLQTAQNMQQRYQDVNNVIDDASADGNSMRFYMLPVALSLNMGLNMSASAAFDAGTNSGTPLGIATICITCSPSESLYERIKSGQGWGWNSDKPKQQETPAPQPSKPKTEEDEYKEYYEQSLYRLKGLPYSMRPFWGMDKDKLNRFKKRFEKDHKFVNAELSKYKLSKVGHDPSGIVYEAVLSNPLEGATAQLYTYNPNAAAAGLDAATFVDASQFGIEENPQVTGADGRYQWFVPEGFWQVRVSKKGYETFSTGNLETGMNYGLDATRDLDGDGVDDADAYWMPVLPVQLDVNIGLVSLEPPKVASMEAGEDGVTVTFSKYMRAGSVTADLFAVNGLEPAAVEPVDAEEAGDGSGVLLARTFRLAYPESLGLAVGSNDLTVTYDDAGQAATSYAGVVVSAEDSSVSMACPVDISPADIAQASIAGIASKVYTGKALTPAITVTLGGKTLVAGTDYTVSYANNVNAGTATVTVAGKGSYAGTARATFQITQAEQTITVDKTECVTKKTMKLGAKATGGGKLTYKTSKKKVATVSAKGVVKGVKAGTAKITITAAATKNYKAATKVVKVKVGKANTLGAKAKKKTVTVSATKVAKAKQVLANNVKPTKPVGKVTYANASTNATAKRFTVNKKTGKITVPKGTKKGTYKVVVKVRAAGNSKTISGTKTVKFKVKVK